MVCTAADAHVIELARLCSQASFDVAQVFAVGKLRERHAEILIEERKRFDFVFAPVTRYPATKRHSGRCSMICTRTPAYPWPSMPPANVPRRMANISGAVQIETRNKTVAVEQSIDVGTLLVYRSNLSACYRLNSPSLTALLTACADVTQSSLWRADFK
jgi:hypothetical protein